MKPPAESVAGVVDAGLCCGCGACVVACESGAITTAEGRDYDYARVDADRCVRCGRCLRICPGARIGAADLAPAEAGPAGGASFHLAWAADAGLRKAAASGGAVTALCAHLLESGLADGAVMVRPDEDRPLFNRSVVARSAAEAAECRGSRYAPAAACLALADVRGRPGRYVFVGKPCEIEALELLKGELPELAQRVFLTIGIFCAQTPARSRTRRLLEKRSLKPGELDRIDYRGNGWPGTFRAAAAGRVLHEEPYASAFAFLAASVPALRCFLCADHAASMADIAAGDPWDAAGQVDVGEGMTRVIARTRAGAAALEEAVAAGALFEVAAPADMPAIAARRDARWRETARRRREVYAAVSGGRPALKPLLENGLSGILTLLRRRLRRSHY